MTKQSNHLGVARHGSLPERAFLHRRSPSDYGNQAPREE
jgi:hypothetical protein